MNPLIQFKTITLALLITVVLGCLVPIAQAQLPSPAPDGGYPGDNTAEGDSALSGLTTGGANTAVGSAALFNITTGSVNTAVGPIALFNNSTADFNTAVGPVALFSNTTGTGNTANGAGALEMNTTGSGNIALGIIAGFNLTTGNFNIDIGNIGVADEANTIRIGTAAVHSTTFIAGIRDVSVEDFQLVVIDPDGQLGSVDGCNFVQNCQASKPTASAKTSRHLDRQIARYEADNAKLRRKVEKLETAIAQQQKDSQLTAANQQKEIRALTAALKEQASQIQKVSAQLELSKPAPQTVRNQ